MNSTRRSDGVDQATDRFSMTVKAGIGLVLGGVLVCVGHAWFLVAGVLYLMSGAVITLGVRSRERAARTLAKGDLVGVLAGCALVVALATLGRWWGLALGVVVVVDVFERLVRGQRVLRG
jgi:hypothetical protein